MIEYKQKLIELVNKNKAEPLNGDFNQVEINDYNGMVAEMSHHNVGETKFNLDYLAYLQPTVCERCGK